MHLRSIKLKGYKRFTDTTIDDIPQSAHLIVLAGPNGSGKSSLFDGLVTWHTAHGRQRTAQWDESYGTKVGTDAMSWSQRVLVEFHESMPTEVEEQKKLIYVRSAFRNEADFSAGSFQRMESPLDRPKVNRMIDNDVNVAENFQRLIMRTIDGIYDDDLPTGLTRIELRDRIIGRVRKAMEAVFPNLVLQGVGGVGRATGATVGTFYFAKGASKGFLYKNLSGGEKAVFDLVLDMVIKAEFFDNSVWCIDEPESHLNTRVQGVLLETLLELLPVGSQLVVASHSLGFMRKAWELAKTDPGRVCFIDMDGHDFDGAVTIKPVKPSRDFWAKTLDVALGDLATLVAPERVVLCEGRPLGTDDRRAEFDASCYRKIFAEEFSDTDFISVGNSDRAANDKLEVGRTIQTVASGTSVTRLIDRDLRTDAEVEQLRAQGVRVLSRRSIESFLYDDEVIEKLCSKAEKPECIAESLLIKKAAVEASVVRGNDADDMKSAAGETYNGIRRLLGLHNAGSSAMAFARDVLAPLVVPGLRVYDELKRDVFGSVTSDPS